MYLRLTNHEYITSYTDNGYEMEVARAIVEKGARPLVGPNLTAKNFYIPPSYPYLLAIFYKIGNGEIFKISYFFVLLNLIGITSLTLFFYKRTKNYILSSLLFLVMANLEILIKESTIIWHPHPTTAFTFISFLLLELAIEKDKLYIMFLGLISYFFAISIYLSPIFLFPLVIFLINEFIKNKKEKKKNILIILILAISSLLIVYLPQLIFEFKNKFPTVFSILNKETLSINEKQSFKESFLSMFYVLRARLHLNDFTFISIIIFIITASVHFKRNNMFNIFTVLLLVIINTFFIPGEAWVHRLSFAIIAIVFSLFEITNEAIKRRNLFFTIISIIFLYIISKNNWLINKVIIKHINYSDSWKNTLLISENINQIIIDKKLDPDKTFLYTPSGNLPGNTDLWKYQWKWFTNIYNSVINQKNNKDIQLDENFKIYKTKNYTMSEPGNFLLICKDNQKNCFINFKKTINDYLPQKGYSYLELVDEYEVNLENKSLTRIYLFETK